MADVRIPDLPNKATPDGTELLEISEDPGSFHITINSLSAIYQPINEKGIAGGYASLDGSGLVPLAQIPPSALTNTFVFVGNASNLAIGVALSGDATITNTGVLTIANDAITTVKIINDAVTLAKLAAGTAGNLISYDALGDPIAVATGSANQILTSNGAGLAPTFQPAPPSGITSINGDSTAAQVIAGTTNRITVNSAVGTTTLDIGSDVVTLSGSQVLTNKTIDGDSNTIVDINETQMNVSVGASGTVLTSNGIGLAPTYQVVAGTGDVVGPASATDQAVTLFDGITGKLIKNSDLIYDFTTTKQLTLPGPIILSAAGTVPAGTNTYLREDANDLDINVNSVNDVNIQFGGTPQYTFDSTQADFTGNNLINAILTVASTLSGTTVTTGLAYNNGIKQTFNPSTSNAGINVGAEVSDPSSPVDGDIFYNSTTNQLRARVNTAWVSLGGGTGDVTGPASSADNEIARFNGVTGKIIQATTIPVLLSDAGEPTWPRSIQFTSYTATPAGTIGYVVNLLNELYFNGNTGHRFFVNNVQKITIGSNVMALTGGYKLQVDSDATEAGFRDAGHTGDPSSPAAGDLYYNTTTNKYRSYNGATWDELGVSGSQTPILSDIDYDGFDITDLSNIEFRTTTLAPGVTVQAIWADANGIRLNVPTGDTFIMSFNGSTRYTFGTNDITLLNRDLLQTGNVNFGAGAIPAGTQQSIWSDNATHVGINVPTGDEIRFYINAVEGFSYSATIMDLFNRNIQNAGNVFMENITGSATLRIENTAAAPVIGQFAGIVQFRGDRTASTPIDYGLINVEMSNVGAATADGEMRFGCAVNGADATLHTFIHLNPNGSQTIHFTRNVQDFLMDNVTGTGDIQSLLGLDFNDDATRFGGTLTYVQFSNSVLYGNVPTGDSIEFSINNVAQMTLAVNQITIPAGVDLDALGDVVVGDRLQGNKGADVASATTITLVDGNLFDITGTTTIDAMTSTGWQAGSLVVLHFDAALTVRHNIGADGFFLQGAVNFSATADDTLTLVWNGTRWEEISRSVN